MQNITIDITKRGVAPLVNVTDYDSMSRFFTLTVLDGGIPYTPPDNPNYSVWYKTNDGAGWYDTITLPNETTRPAVTADGNVLTVEIAEQATTSSGELGVMITGDDGYQLTVTGIMTRSSDIPGYDGEEVENYYNVFITRMQENAARAENAADIAVAYGATVEVDEDAQQLNITHHSDTEGGVGWLFGSAVTSSAEGSVAAFPDGANDVAVKSLVAEITPVQSGSGDPSPTNVRAISGRTGLTVTRCGKNLLENNWGGLSRTQNGLTITVENDGTITANGTATASGVIIANFGVANSSTATQNWRKRALPNGTYRFVGTGDGFNLQVRGTNDEAGNADTPIAASNVSGTFTIDDTYKYNWVRFQFSNGATATNKKLTFMIVPVGITNDTYEPYTASSYPVTWETEAGEVYGGTLDVVSGVLTVKGVLKTLTGNENFGLQTNSRRFTKAFTALEWERANTVVSTQNQSNSLCSHATYLTGATGTATPADYRITNDSNNLQAIAFYDTQTQFANAAAFNAYLAAQYANGTPVQLYYDLATPLAPIQLSPTEVKTLLGGNTIYTDAGAVSVEYVADTKLYIDNKVAELQALILEN